MDAFAASVWTRSCFGGSEVRAFGGVAIAIAQPFEMGDKTLRGGVVLRALFEVSVEGAHGLDIGIPYAEQTLDIGDIAQSAS